jgi:hypothetical protein
MAQVSMTGGQAMAWRAGAKLFRETWPLIQAHVPEENSRPEFVRDLIQFFMDYDMDGTDLRRIHPEIDKALDELGVGEG